MVYGNFDNFLPRNNTKEQFSVSLDNVHYCHKIFLKSKSFFSFSIEQEQKRIVIERCLDQNPPPPLETVNDPKQIDDHREVVTTCALKFEGWFNADGSYKFDRAKSEIESKKLEKQVERNISRRHQECQQEAVKRFPGGYIQQVQLYQACMDYHIAEICEIELIPPPGGFEGLEGLADYEGELGAAFPEFAGQPIDSANQPQPSPQPASRS
nr:uncharacterized protein LOC107439531 [Parasteatoda tepidariorum]